MSVRSNFSLAVLISLFMITPSPAEETVLPENGEAVILQPASDAPGHADLHADLPILINAEPPEIVPMSGEVLQAAPAEVPAAAAPAPVIKTEKIVQSVQGRTAFNKMKSLAGDWEAAAKAGPGHDEDEKISVEYRITAGGNAVIERLFPGTPQEMATMYYENNGKLTLTHYCMLGNRPVMELKNAEGNVYEFDLLPVPGIDPQIDTHMHSLKIVFVDNDHMSQEWTMFEAGKAAGTHSFKLSRVPAR